MPVMMVEWIVHTRMFESGPRWLDSRVRIIKAYQALALRVMQAQAVLDSLRPVWRRLHLMHFKLIK
jgi:hypothetical protein